MDLDLLARQLARLLSGSDFDELREVVVYWLDSASSPRDRERMQELGERVLMLKSALVASGRNPSEAELTTMLQPLMGLAALHQDQVVRAQPPAGEDEPPGRI